MKKRLSTGFIILLSVTSIMFATLAPDWRHQFATAGNYSNTLPLLTLPAILSSNKDQLAPK